MRVYDLRCEYETRPLGLSEPKPRFFWKCRYPHETEEREDDPTCILEVATSIEVLRNGAPDVWTSEAFAASSVCVEYAGPALTSFSRYFWRLTDSRSREHLPHDDRDASRVAEFWTGALTPPDWGSGWVTSGNPRAYDSSDSPFVITITEYHAMYFVQSFELPRHKGVARAQLCVAARGIAVPYVNGKRVGRSLLDPATTNYEQRSLYSAYDVTDLLDSENVAGIVLGNGRHIEAYGYSTPSFSVLLVVEYSDGSQERVLADSKWRVGEGPISMNGIYYGEVYDARNEIPAWATLGQSLANWRPATLVEPRSNYATAIERAAPVQNEEPTYQVIDPIEVTREVEPVELWKSGPGTYVFDFGQNLTGVTEVIGHAPAGTTVTIRHSELIDEAGRLNTLPNRNARATNEFTFSGKGRERYRPMLTQHGFRYAEVSGFRGAPTLDSLRAVCFHTAAREVGTFSSSSKLLNDVHRITRWSQRANLIGIPTDCPQRDERMGWLGDAQLASEQALYNFDMSRAYTKYLEDIRLSQRSDGALSNVVPDFWKLYPADPAWGSAYPTIAWNTYFFYNDVRVLSRHYEGIARYLGYLDSIANESIIDSITLIGDWCPPASITPKRTPGELTGTWYYYHDTLLLLEMARVLGKAAEIDRLEGKAAAIRAAFNKRFLKEHGYAVNQMTPTDVMPSQTSNVLPLYLDMVPKESRDLVVGRLLESIIKHHDYHLDTGIVGTRYLFDVLTRLGYDEVAYKIATRTSYPGWGYMLREGATTLWEHWEKIEGEGMNSNNHIMLGSIDAWYYSTIAGLRPAEAGWRRVAFAPHPVGDLSYATASVETIRGTAAISWEREDQGEEMVLRVAFTVPGASTATIAVPPGRTLKSATLNGQRTDSLPDVFEAGHHSLTLEVSKRTPPAEPQWREYNALRRSIAPGRV